MRAAILILSVICIAASFAWAQRVSEAWDCRCDTCCELILEEVINDQAD